MKTRILAALLLAIGLTAAPTFAHGGMVHTSIQDNEKLAIAPTEFKVTFQHESAITSIALTTADKKPLPLNFKPSKVLTTEFKISLPPLSAGSYVLSWKSMAKDGHTMPDTVRFTITGH